MQHEDYQCARGLDGECQGEKRDVQVKIAELLPLACVLTLRLAR